MSEAIRYKKIKWRAWFVGSIWYTYGRASTHIILFKGVCKKDIGKDSACKCRADVRKDEHAMKKKRMSGRPEYLYEVPWKAVYAASNVASSSSMQ